MKATNLPSGLVNIATALFRRSVPLEHWHDTTSFDCGNEGLNAFLKNEALKNQRECKERTFVVTLGSSRIAGFYTLRARIQGTPGHEIAVLEVGRLASDEEFRGLGATLWKDADERRFARR